MSKNSEAVKKWRKSAKKIIVDCLGGCCQVCGYDRASSALELHHVNPAEKDFSFGFIMASCRSWHVIYLELAKCILLCCRCHREVHEGIIEIPTNYKKFIPEEADKLRSTSSLKSQRIFSDDEMITKAKDRQERKRLRNIASMKSRMYRNDTSRSKILERIKLLQNAAIDYSKFGWTIKAAKIVGIEPAPLVRWMKKHMEYFYNTKCFKNNSGVAQR